MVQLTVLKVCISCEKCKKEHFKVVSKIEGVNKIEVDVEKGTMTVLGEVDPFVLIKCLRKAGKSVHFVSVGPPPPKPDPPKPKPVCQCPGGYCSYYWACPPAYPPACAPVAMMTLDYPDNNPCSIM